MVAELELEDETSYFNYFRMDREHFGMLSDLIESRIRKCDTAMRASIKPEERLAVTLRYLATGESFKSLEFQFRISRTAISNIVVETCQAIFNVLSEEVLKLPSTPEGWLHLASLFEKRWNFPNGIGAIDGKRINIQQPGNSGSHYYDYKGHNSLILLAAVGPQYEILWADVGANGRVSDGTVLQKCALKNALTAENNPLNIPQPRPLPGRRKPVPFVFTGDDAFALTTYMMKPYPQSGLDCEKRIFNYRLSRNRRISENAFGILANRWRILRSAIPLCPEKVTCLTLAVITLHNFLLQSPTYIPPNLVDVEVSATGHVIPGTWRNEALPSSWLNYKPNCSNNYSGDAKAIREEYLQYFNNEGVVHWQWLQCGID